MQVMKLLDWPNQVPLGIHLLINSNCNLSCPECFYKSPTKAEIDLPTITRLFDEWCESGVKSVAIGGGEPLLHPDIQDICKEARLRGLYVAVTTNGTIKSPITANRVHISFDQIHPTTKDELLGAVNYYKRFVPNVGVNHIVTDLERLDEVLALDSSLTVTLLLEKPTPRFKEWRSLLDRLRTPRKHRQRQTPDLWLDACLALKLLRKPCHQGTTSMSLNQTLLASRCSNIKHKVAYTTLAETWKKVQSQCCPLRDVPNQVTRREAAAPTSPSFFPQ